MTLQEMRKKIQEDTNNLVTTPISHESENKEGPLKEYGITIKECICVQGVESTAGSGILKGYIPPFDATVMQKIRAAGGTLLGKASQEEFGYGGFGTNVGKGYKIPTNPLDPTRSAGGSSAGSGGITAVLKGMKHISIGESTGGSIAAPAACCGVVGLTPTYGLVSRYGLISYGNSLDKIGPLAATVQETALALNIIAGYDEKDSTSVKREEEDYTAAIGKSIKGMKVGVIQQLVDGADEEVQQEINRAIEFLKKEGATIESVSLPTTEKAGIATYYIVAMCETSTNLAKYCGIRYGAAEDLQGNFNEYFTTVRSNHFAEEAKRRLLIGTFARMAGFRDAYYLKALQVRAKIIAEYKEAFQKYDVLLSPTLPCIAPKLETIHSLSPAQLYMMDQCIAPANLAGLPHISIPVGGNQEQLPAGLLLIGDHFAESKILTAAHAIEQGVKQ